MKRLAISALLIVTPAYAAAPCKPHHETVMQLWRQFKETRFAMGLSNSGALVEVHLSRRGTWTVVVTNIRKRACIVAAGKSWVHMPVKPVGDNL